MAKAILYMLTLINYGVIKTNYFNIFEEFSHRGDDRTLQTEQSEQYFKYLIAFFINYYNNT